MLAVSEGVEAPLSRGERTRARILASGSEVFARLGYHAARVDDVVESAGTSHGTFYLYFSSKEDLLHSLIREATTAMHSLIEAMPRLRRGPDTRARLREWLAQFVEVYSRHGAILRTWTETEVAGDGVGQLGADLIGGLSGAVADKVALPRATELDPGVATLAIVVMIERLTYLHSSGQVDASPDELLDVLADTIEDILFAAPTRPARSGVRS